NGTDNAVWNDLMKGDVPGIAAYALHDTIEKRPQLVQAFVDGMVKAQDYINQHTGEEITELVYDTYLHALARASVQSSIQLYKQTVWLQDNIITQDAYDRMAGIMGEGRQFSNEDMAKVPYERCVDMSFVRKARGIGA